MKQVEDRRHTAKASSEAGFISAWKDIYQSRFCNAVVSSDLFPHPNPYINYIPPQKYLPTLLFVELVTELNFN